MPSLRLTRDELRAAFPEELYRHGAEYQRAGRVPEIRHRRDRFLELVSGRVVEPQGRRYTAHVAIARERDGVFIDGDCSCRVGANCEHVVAILLEALARPADPGQAEVGSPAVLEPEADTWALELWADEIARASAEPLSDRARAGARAERLLYVLDEQPQPSSLPLLRVHVITCRPLKRGGYGQPRGFRIGRALEAHPPRVLGDADIGILRLLVGSEDEHGPVILAGSLGASALERMLATGRCHWLDRNTPALARGEARAATCEWSLADDGRQWLVLRADPPASAILRLSPPWYLDREAGCCGPLELGLAPALAAAIAAAPAVRPEQARHLPAALLERLRALDLPAPRVPEIEERSGRPVPCLYLLASANDPAPPREHPWYGPAPKVPSARLRFDYGGAEIDCDPDGEPLVTVRHGDERLLRIHRDAAFEREALARLAECALIARAASRGLGWWYKAPPGDLIPAEDAGPESEIWLSFVRYHVPALREAGWRIAIDEDFEFHALEPDSWYAETAEAEERGWFDLELGIVVAGRRVPLLPVLHRIFSQGDALAMLAEQADDDELLVQLSGGEWLALPAGRLRTIVGTLLELTDPTLRLAGERVRLSEWRAPGLAELGGSGLEWRGGERLRRLARRLAECRGVEPASEPPGFAAELRPYQRHGLGWLQLLGEHRLGGVLADDMGLGKTVQTLAHLLLERQAGRLDRPALVVAPTSLTTNWAVEARRFAPALRTLVLHGPGRGERFAEIGDHDLVITTYALLPRDAEALAAQPYHLLVLDEAQYIKNPRTKAAQVLRTLEARSRLCLTGTPLENHLGELWSLFHFLEPGLLGDARQFRRLFRTPIERHGEREREAALRRRVAPFLLRRTKEEVLPELPEKTTIERVVELDGGQRDLYESIRAAMHERLRAAIARRGIEQSQILILDALLKLRQVCCDPRLVRLPSARRVRASAKLALLMELLPEMVAEGRRVLLFSQFTSMLALIEEALAAREIAYLTLTGQTRDRATPVARFQAGEVPVFLISLKAGGTGLNLTAADTVIHYDPWWNPAVEDQATDRAHRIGQDKKVFVYKLITAGTVEERILALQASKRRIADAVLAPAAAGGRAALDAEAIEALFAPLG